MPIKKITLCIVYLLTSINFWGQNSYSTLLCQGIETAENADDSLTRRSALNLFEQAFKTYPDSIEERGYYEASVLAAQLNEKQQAFHYLDSLVNMEGIYGPGYQFLLDEDAETEYKNLFQDARWDTLVARSYQQKKLFYERLKNQEIEFFAHRPMPSFNKKKEELYLQLKNLHPYKRKSQRNYSIQFPINDSIHSSFYVHLPADYNPDKSYPVLFFLHGAVRYSEFTDFQSEYMLGSWNRFYTRYADKAQVILVLPQANNQYNWMTPDDGFYMIPAMLRKLKSALNIDDNKVFISGHSNGATGSFSYWIKQSTPFAGFFGFNTQPKVYTGGTFLRNGLNRFFTNFSTDQDYYFPPQANDSLKVLATSLHLNYEDHRYNGFPHSFPEFDASEAAYKILFHQIVTRRRNPFPEEVTWETDNVKYGQMDWLDITELDTLSQRANWHRSINFTIHKWLEYNNKKELVTKEINKEAFYFPRKSGAIEAKFDNNIFSIKTSCVKAFRLYISPEMVNIKKSVSIYVNGNRVFHNKVKYNDDFMMSSFEQQKDRKQIWVNYIDIQL